MLIIPAIDLKEGKVVRLFRGDFEKKKTYSLDPIKTAREWEKQGARYLHVVDLDGAKTGRICNLDIIKKIAKAVRIPVEFGGGVRDQNSIRKVLNCGVQRVILGTKLEDEKFLRKAFREFKQRVVVSIDAQESVVKLRGWQEEYRDSGILELIRRLEDIGFKEIIYTDIARNGTLKGPNITMVKKILKNSGLSVILAGGISSLLDIHRLKPLAKHGLAGIIIGKALYEGRFTLEEAMKAV